MSMPALAAIPVQFLWFISPEWAIPANTMLLIVLAVVQRREHRRAREAVGEARRAVKHANHAAQIAEDTYTIVDRRRQNLPDNGMRRRHDDNDNVRQING